MNKLFNIQIIFSFFLRRLNDLRKHKWSARLIMPIARIFARLNLLINKPAVCTTTEELGRTWQKLMPWNNQKDYQLISFDETKATVKISICCPLRGNNDSESEARGQACEKFMEYDRTLMKKVGGILTVKESQATSGENYCILFIELQKSGADHLESDCLARNKTIKP